MAFRPASGIRLRPGAFLALFGVPARELLDARVRRADLVSRPADLAGLAAGACAPDPLAEAAMRADPAALARDSGYGERHLE